MQERELKEEEAILQQEAEQKLAELEKEIEEEKQNNLSTMSEDEIANFMSVLKKQEEAKRSVKKWVYLFVSSYVYWFSYLCLN